jgi:MFS family permease
MVFVGVAALNLGVGMIIPILPLYARTYGASPAAIGLMLSASALGRLLFQAPGGYLSDRYQDRKIAAIGTGLYIPSMLLMALLPHPLLFIALRFLEGIAEGLAIPAFYSLVATRAHPQRVGGAFGLFSSFATGGLAIGPALGGALASGFGPQSIFLAAAGVTGLVSVFVARLPAPPRHEGLPARNRRERLGPIRALRALGKTREAQGLLPANTFSFLTKFAFSGIQALFPLYLAEHLHVGSKFVGALFTLNFVLYSIGQPAGGWLSDRLRAGQDVVIGGLVVGMVFVLLPLTPSVWLFLTLFSLEVLAASWLTVGIRRLVALTVEARDTGKAYGIVGAVGDIGAFSGPPTVSLMYQWAPSAPFLVTGVISFLAVLTSVPALLHGRSPSAEPS